MKKLLFLTLSLVVFLSFFVTTKHKKSFEHLSFKSLFMVSDKKIGNRKIENEFEIINSSEKIEKINEAFFNQSFEGKAQYLLLGLRDRDIAVSNLSKNLTRNLLIEKAHDADNLSELDEDTLFYLLSEFSMYGRDQIEIIKKANPDSPLFKLFLKFNLEV